LSLSPPHLHSFPTRRSSDLACVKLSTILLPRINHFLSRHCHSMGWNEPCNPLGNCTASQVAECGGGMHEGLPVDAADRYSLDCRSEEHTSELQSQSNLVCRL